MSNLGPHSKGTMDVIRQSCKPRYENQMGGLIDAISHGFETPENVRARVSFPCSSHSHACPKTYVTPAHARRLHWLPNAHHWRTFRTSGRDHGAPARPGGCPWDREQTFDSIKPYTLEETYEVLEAIDNRDWQNWPASSATCCCRCSSMPRWRKSSQHSRSTMCSTGSPPSSLIAIRMCLVT